MLLTYFSQAIASAHVARAICAPNPAVGCAVVCVDGRTASLGHTQPTGHAHAEVMALRDAAARGLPVAGATAYVTLEPCSHHGRTPPCCNALIEAGIAKVVVAVLDPNPLVSGRGVQMLRDAGIEVEVLPTDNPEAVASRELNIGFFSRMIRKTPWVRMKIAASLDGQTALANGASQWITGEAARTDGHAWRARSCAVLTGIGTVLQDDPLLDVRHVATPRQPHLVIVDSKLETPLNAKLFSTLGKRGGSGEPFGLSQDAMDSIAGRTLLIYAAVPNEARKRALEALGATVIYLPEQDQPQAVPVNPSDKKVDLAAMVRDLGQREINELHVEAGFKLNGSLLKAGVVDELLVYTAPMLLGTGMGMANMPALAALGDAVQLDFTSAQMVGQDLRLVARLRGRDQF
ncbi:MAG: bifunctional diaminohydroxyphosphoribosylaminopyrimidine deaminase/5-amino-6-(5-phosphoribosylamino)uracil reductase RibD [Burkholderiaceae bacterium]